jgi:hypothetical protein
MDPILGLEGYLLKDMSNSKTFYVKGFIDPRTAS